MTREEVHTLALESIDRYNLTKRNCTVLECGTGFGKTKIAIDMANKLCDYVYHSENEPAFILILVAKRVHKQTWIDEIEKWGGLKSDNVVIECYESLKKYKNAYFDIIILDEAHHIQSKARLELLNSMFIAHHLICLSATMPKKLKDWLRYSSKFNTNIISCNLQEAIDDEVLPEPRIYLIPLGFDNERSEVLEYNIRKNTNPKDIQYIDWHKRWSARKNGIPCRVKCTKRQYLDEVDSLIEWYKKKGLTNRQMHLANTRLKWLSNLKTGYVLSVLKDLKDYRTLTFCNSIEQTELLGKYCINSKNKKAAEYLEMFNNMRIKHITACQQLNEGVNLTNCRIGIFANVNASEIIHRQRMGRLLRHKKPIVIIPYYKGTREEEILKKMLSEYDKELIKEVKSISDIEL